MTWRTDHPGGVISCDHPSCTRTRRNYCTPTERDQWVAYTGRTNGVPVVMDRCPEHRKEAPTP